MQDRKNFLVLVVEDEFLLRLELADELARAGWRVAEAANGEEALTKLDGVDFLITDVRLPGALDGWAVAAAARRHRADLPVIYVSANPVNDERRVPGAVFLTKPVHLHQLLQLCDRMMRGQ